MTEITEIQQATDTGHSKICAALGRDGRALRVARSNVSTSLKELQSWGLVRFVHVMGDWRDHFDTSKDQGEPAKEMRV